MQKFDKSGNLGTWDAFAFPGPNLELSNESIPAFCCSARIARRAPRLREQQPPERVGRARADEEGTRATIALSQRTVRARIDDKCADEEALPSL